MPEFNPLAYAREGRESANALFDTFGQARAGRQYADGDTAGAANTLARYGMIDDAMGLQRQQATMARQAKTDAASERDDDMKWLGQAASGLRAVPYDQRREIYMRQVRPLLQQNGLDDAELAQVDAADLTDGELDSLLGTLGGTVTAPYASDVAGPNGSRLRPDRYTGTYSQVYAPEFDPRVGAPAGYMWTDETRTRQVAIPGGSADPSVAGNLAASRRAPPRARSSGGGGSRSSGSGSRPASSGTKNPWDQDY